MSYVKVKSGIVRECCAKAIDGIKKRREKMVSEFVSEETRKLNDGFIRRWFSLKPVSEEKFIEDIDSMSFGLRIGYNMRQKSWWKEEEGNLEALLLLSRANSVDECVEVSGKDLVLVGKWVGDDILKKLFKNGDEKQQS